MHAIKEKPVVVNGQIVVRPIMVVALTYDHRLLDGREAVTFLGQFSVAWEFFLADLALACSSHQGVHRGPSKNALAIASMMDGTVYM